MLSFVCESSGAKRPTWLTDVDCMYCCATGTKRLQLAQISFATGSRSQLSCMQLRATIWRCSVRMERESFAAWSAACIVSLRM